MKPEVKAEWVSALRSDEYKQGRGALRSKDDKLCCLGVLCEVAVKRGVIPAPKLGEDDPDRGYEYGLGAETAFLPHEVMDWAGFSDDCPEVTYDGEPTSPVEANDGFELPFPEIADLIEENL